MAFVFKGRDEMIAAIRRLADTFPEKVGAALYQDGEETMAISKADYVPVDLGTLRNSGMVAQPVYSGNQISVELSYGGAAAAYALVVHEHPSAIDPPSWEGVEIVFSPSGHGPKYLERPIMDRVDGMADRIGARLRMSLEN